MKAALAATLGLALMLALPQTGLAEPAPMQVDLPKVSLRIPNQSARLQEGTRQMSVAVTLFVAEDLIERFEWRGGDVRARIFDACAASYFRFRGAEPDGLDLTLLREHVAEEIRASLGGRDLKVMFRELAIR